MSDEAIAGRIGFIAGCTFVSFMALVLHSALTCPQHDIGRCEGWADAQGLVAAWDSEGRCVLGDRVAEGVE